jgi:nicotinate (nicotinamide) nucleotide adenylyltransferase
VFPGTFNPPTRAHLAMARAALAHAESVVFVLPRVFPHKEWEGARLEDRMAMLEAAIAGEPRFSIASTARGLFIEIARELRATYGAGAELCFLCGRDAAERIVNWDYGRAGAIGEQLREYRLLVAPRRGAYTPPAEIASRVETLPLDEDCDDVSATGVRERIRDGRPWRGLVPEAIADTVERLYSK